MSHLIVSRVLDVLHLLQSESVIKPCIKNDNPLMDYMCNFPGNVMC